MRRILPWLGMLAALGCSSNDSKTSGWLLVGTGHETDVWSDVDRIELVVRTQDNDESVFATVDPPVDGEYVRFDLSGAPQGVLEVRGLDEEDHVVATGETAAVDPSRLYGRSIYALAGRTGSFNRPPGQLWEDGQGEYPPVALFGSSYVAMAGCPHTGDAAARLDAYDFLLWGPASVSLIPCPRLGCHVASLATLDNGLVVLIGSDWATYADFACGSDCTGELEQPASFDWEDLAGGQSVRRSGEATFVVGATRPEGPTTAVLELGAPGWIAEFTLETPRAGAAATWVEDRGLVVLGGADGDAPGAELLEDNEETFTALPLPPDTTQGAAIVAFDNRRLLRVGGKLAGGDWAPSVVYDLACTSDCEPKIFGSPLELMRASAFRLVESVLVVGTAADGFTKAVLLTADGPQTIELREPRRGASATTSPAGRVVLVGGVLETDEPALTLELYFP